MGLQLRNVVGQRGVNWQLATRTGHIAEKTGESLGYFGFDAETNRPRAKNDIT
jgi:hypothetical protein